MHIRNIFKDIKLPNGAEEAFDTLCNAQKVKVERIISKGQTTPPGKWYDSGKYEWVVLIQGRASLEMEDGKIIHLTHGDHLLIPAHQKHRVSYTSKNPHCIWLAVHFD